MTDHRFLTPDRNVQQTTFSVPARRGPSKGITITVNFGDNPYRLPDGKEVEPMGYHITGL
jgi:hypothetical protein